MRLYSFTKIFFPPLQLNLNLKMTFLSLTLHLLCQIITQLARSNSLTDSNTFISFFFNSKQYIFILANSRVYTQIYSLVHKFLLFIKFTFSYTNTNFFFISFLISFTIIYTSSHQITSPKHPHLKNSDSVWRFTSITFYRKYSSNETSSKVRF
ncbi:uncharacterized protein DS421_11g332830 [Arachis hypogaea]|nr:uncharacterized protein DS421_11g332830 [Arachis hypogaea]QHO19870.1 uncharacterized protein DS421_11g332830 [Arachis hypogaea]